MLSVVKVKDAETLRDVQKYQKMKEQTMFGIEVVKPGGGK